MVARILITSSQSRRFHACSDATTTANCSSVDLGFAYPTVPSTVPLSLVRSPLDSFGVGCYIVIAFARVITGGFSSVPALWPFITIYSIWAFGIDSSPRTGGRPSRRFRNLVFWKYFAQYYPQELVKVRGVVESYPVSIPQSQTTTF